jgi:hypothetical protein
VRGEEQRDQAPGERVVEVVDQAGLGAGAQRGGPPGRLREGLPHRRRHGIVAGLVARLLERDVRGGVAHEDDRHHERGDGDGCAGDDEDVARRVLGGEPPRGHGRKGDAAVAGGFVEAECQPAAFGSDEVDLHDDGHGPREPLIDAEQHGWRR